MQETWTNKASFLLPHTLPLLLIVGLFTQSPYLFIGLFALYFTALNVLDHCIKRESAMNYTNVADLLANQGTGILNWYRIWIYLFIVLYFVLLFGGIYNAEFKVPRLGWLLYAIPVGIMAAIILTICHELMHTKYRFEKVLARIVASFSFWGLHEYEHLFFHHNNDFICTDDDKSYAKLNQSVYSFTILALIGNYKHAWQVQKQVAKRKNQAFYNPFTNLLLQIYLCSILVIILTYLLTGIYGCLFLLIQGILGFIFFLAITYNQHYGLTRRKVTADQYEPFTFMNVWSTDFTISSKIFFNVTHHSHHHKHQFCHYEFLEIIDKSPLLPYNYNIMFAISLIPPLWYKIMNPRVAKVLEARDRYAKEGMKM